MDILLIKMCDTTNASTQSIADYLAQLLKDRKQLAAFPNVFIHVERLLDEGEFFLLPLCEFSRIFHPVGAAAGRFSVFSPTYGIYR